MTSPAEPFEYVRHKGGRGIRSGRTPEEQRAVNRERTRRYRERLYAEGFRYVRGRLRPPKESAGGGGQP